MKVWHNSKKYDITTIKKSHLLFISDLLGIVNICELNKSIIEGIINRCDASPQARNTLFRFRENMVDLQDDSSCYLSYRNVSKLIDFLNDVCKILN